MQSHRFTRRFVSRVVGYAWLAAGAAPSCSSFATVRSARVTPGSSFTMQAAVASPPGDAAAWFWSLDCTDQCNHAIPGVDLAFASGQRTASRTPFTIGGGLNGFYPYVEGYLQVDTTRARPFGIGVRAGIPISGWMQHQLYARVDLVRTSSVRLLWNPGVVYHTGHSPNGSNAGTFLGLTQAFGAAIGAGSAVFTPSVSMVWGRTERRGFTSEAGTSSRLFGTASVSVTFRKHD